MWIICNADVYKLNVFNNCLHCYANNDTLCVRSSFAAEMSSSFSEDDKTEETSSFEDWEIYSFQRKVKKCRSCSDSWIPICW